MVQPPDNPMKKKISFKFILVPAFLAALWMGSQSPQTASAQDPLPPQTGIVPDSASPDTPTAAATLPPDVDPDSPLAQVIRLVQANVEQSVILAYISNATNLFNLNAEEIIYLNDLGAPPEIANAIMQHDQQLQQAGTATNTSETSPPAGTEPPPPPPTEATVTYFYSTLAPYGGWVNLGGYGWCWRPTIVTYNSGWQPYCNNGYWVYSNCGWYWVSGYSWGWATFHYGRWFCHPHYGWCWWPDTTWAPSWVCWRYNQDYCGWAPLPPHAVYQSGVGFVYQGHAVTAGFSFGLNAGAFTFVATKNFCDPHLQRYRVDATESDRVFNQTMVINNIDFNSHQHGIVNAGIPPQHITAITRQEIHPVTIQAGNGSPAWGGKHEQFARNGTTLIVNRPQFVGSPVLTLHPPTAPGTKPGQNQAQPGVYGNGNYSIPHPVNPGQNPRQNINQNPYQNLNRTPPRVPQAQQPATTYVAPPPVGNKPASTPQHYQSWPTQNQVPDHQYNSDSRVQPPRQFGSAPPSQSGTTHDPPPQNNAAREQPYSDPSGNHHYSPPPDGARNNSQSANHPGAAQPNAQPHASTPSSSSSGNQGQNQGNGQNEH
jgi:hypothetical protein